VHIGECEVIDGKPGGLAVTIAARLLGTAGSREVVVTGTVKDLVAGSGFSFTDRGEHELKGVPSSWRLYLVQPTASVPLPAAVVNRPRPDPQSGA
jgi:class 3 adenylate cyclase